MRSFNTAEEGVLWIEEQVRQWRELGRKGLVYRVCYNGSQSVEVARLVS